MEKSFKKFLALLLAVATMLSTSSISMTPIAFAFEGGQFDAEASYEDTQEGATAVDMDETSETAEPAEEVEGNDETPNMPAQSFKASSANGVSVTATAGEGIFPVGTTMRVKDVAASDAKAIAEKSQSNVKDAIGVDITFYDASGNELQPSSGSVAVKLTLPTALKGDEFAVTHKNDSGTVEEVDAEATARGASFDGDSFSIYVVSGSDLTDESGDTHAVAKYVFYDASGKAIEGKNGTQNVITGDKLHAPASPEKDGYKFIGWVVADSMEAAQTKTASDAMDFSGTVTVTTSAELKVFPLFKEVHYAFFMDSTEDGARVAVTKKGVNGDSLNPSEVKLSNLDSEHSVTGWYYDQQLTKPVESNAAFGDKNITLWPKVEKGHYVTFDTRGGSILNPQFVSTDGTVKEPAVPTKAGYTFGGWLDSDNRAYTFGSTIDSDITLHVNWTPKSDVTYSVIYWKQSVNDDKNATDANKTYDFAAYVKRTAAAGATVSLTSADKKMSYEGFHYNTNKTTTSATVNGDGTTVINVYYDRDLMTMEFYEYVYTATTSNYGTQYGRVDGQYVQLTYRWSNWYYNDRPYNGTRYTRSDVLKQKFEGLYEQTLAKNDYTWPSDRNWTFTKPSGSTFMMSFLDAFIFEEGDTNSNTLKFYGDELTSGYTIEFYKESLDGTYSNPPANSVNMNYGSFSFTNKYNGFTVYEYSTDGGTRWTKTSVGDQLTNPSNLKIHYKRKSYNLSFYNYNSQAKAEPVKYEASLSNYADYVPDRPSNVDAKYTFQGWYKDATCTEEFNFDTTMPAGGLVVYAKWAPPVVSGDVYLTEAGTGNSETVPVTYGQPITEAMLPSVYVNGVQKTNGTAARVDVPADHEWVGWATKAADGNFILWNMNNLVTENITLYPFYIDKSNFVVTYDVGAGSGSVADAKTYKQASSADVKSAEGVTAPDGKVFLYWVDKGGAKHYPGSELKINPDLADNRAIKLTAVYGDVADTAKLTYKSNYPSGTQKETYQEVNGTTDLSNYAPFKLYDVEGAGMQVPEGYVFAGWKSDSGAIYDSGATIAVNKKDNVLEAQWKKVIEVKLTPEGYDLYRYRGITKKITTLDKNKCSVAGGTINVSNPAAIKVTVGGKTYTIEGLSVKGEGRNVGTYPVTIKGRESVKVTEDETGEDVTSLFSFTYNDSHLVIIPAPAKVIADNQTKQYGDQDPTLTVHFEGVFEGDEVTYTNISRTPGEDIGEYTITPSGDKEQGNYTVEYKTGALTITKKSDTLQVEATSGEKTYDGKALVGEGKVTGLTADELKEAEVKYSTDDGKTWVDKAPSITDVGEQSYKVKVTHKNYADAEAEGTLKVTPKAVTLTSASAEKTYDGTELTKKEVTAEGFVDGEGAEYNVTGTQTNVGSSDNVFEYTLKSNTKATNYDIARKFGKLKVTKAGTLAVEAVNYNKAYDGATHNGGATPSVEDGTTLKYKVEGSDEWTETAPSIKDVGEIKYTVKAENANYEDATATGTLKVTPKAVTVKANDKTKKFGENDPDFDAAVTGTLGGDKVAYTFSREKGENVGSYTITPSGDENQGNYTVTYETGKLTINKATFTVSATDFVGTYDGQTHRGGATPSVTEGTTIKYQVEGSNKWTETPPSIKNAGVVNYTVKATNPNYEDATDTGTLSVAKKLVTLKSANDSKPYDGKPLTNYQVKAEGFIEGEGATYTVTGSQTDVGSSKNTFDYTLNEGTLEGNYDITMIEGTLTVAPLGTVVVTITENSRTETYDGTEKSVEGYTVSISDPLYKESDFTFNGEAIAKGTFAGEYNMEVKAEDFTNNNDNFMNVTFNVVDGTLTINPIAAELVVTANSNSKVYDGTPLTDGGYTSVGTLADGDELVVTVEGSITSAGTVDNKVTQVKVMHGDVNATSSYTIGESVDGTLEVTKRAVTITSGSATKTYDGKPLTNDEVVAEGFVDGEGAEYTVTGSQTKVGKSANTFEFELNENTDADNYEIEAVEGTLEVTAAPVTPGDSDKPFVKTSDNTNILQYTCVMLAAMLAVIMMMIVRRRRA